MKARVENIPTALIPSHNRVRAYVILQNFSLIVGMTAACKWLILLRFFAFLLFCKQGLTQSDFIIPTLKSEEISLMETTPIKEGEQRYLVSLPDRFRLRHFTFLVDRSACRGSVSVNGDVLVGDEAADTFRFDQSNVIVLRNCLKRSPLPLRLFAHPKVYISEAWGNYDVSSGLLQLELTIRNTLLNSTSISLDAAGNHEDFFLYQHNRMI